MSNNKKYLRVYPDAHVMVLALGEMEIWDGADMSLLRETLTRLIKADKHRSIGIDMTFVKYIPSGFFGMLYDWYEMGIEIRLYAPQPNVRRMLWFYRFFAPVGDSCHELRPPAQADCALGYALAEPLSQASASPRSGEKKLARAGR
jgi:hypothetical protein